MDTTADALPQLCGSFGSADRVVVFEAVEQVRREKLDPDNRNRLLGESLRLFEGAVESLTIENLRYTLVQYQSWNYYPGSGQHDPTVARESDKGSEALGFFAD